MSAVHDLDFYAWADEQAQLARPRSANRPDREFDPDFWPDAAETDGEQAHAAR